MLTAVRLKDFKNHVDTEIRLGRLTCLVGPNGCGKTSVLEGIQFASTTLVQEAVAFFQEPYHFEDFFRKGMAKFTVGVETSGEDSAAVELAVQLSLNKGYSPAEWDRRIQWREAISAFSPKRTSVPETMPPFQVFADWQYSLIEESEFEQPEQTLSTDPAQRVTRRGRQEDLTFKGPSELRSINSNWVGLIPSAFFMVPEIPVLRAPSYSSDETPAISPDGANLASVIAYLITTEPERFAELQARIRTVVPAIQRLRVRPARVQLTEPSTVAVKGREIPYSETREVIGHELLFDLKDAPGIPARAVSEGTLLVTALLTATIWNQGADVLLIDDLEKGLHPKAQRELVTALKALLDTDPKLQIAFSTHSPYVVDELTADQVWVLVPDETRGVVARQLSDHPRAADALQVLTTGEFLSAEGEDWVRETPAAV